MSNRAQRRRAGQRGQLFPPPGQRDPAVPVRGLLTASGAAAASFVKARGLNVGAVELTGPDGRTTIHALALTALDDQERLREPIVLPAGTNWQGLADAILEMGRQVDTAQDSMLDTSDALEVDALANAGDEV